MKKTIRIALAQINPTVGDLKGNVEKIIHFINEAQKLKVDILTFPELSICGYPPEDLLLIEHFVNDNRVALDKVIKKVSKEMTVIVGFVDRDKKGNLYNAAGIINNGRLKAVYHKTELPNYSVFDEKRYFQQGNKPFLFALNGILCGVTICEDIWKQHGIIDFYADKKAQIILNISASPYYTGKGHIREKMLMDYAKKAEVYICYNNLIGGQDELVFDGASIILNAKGQEIARGKQFREDLIVTDLAIDSNQIKYNKYPQFNISAKKPKPVLPERAIVKLNKINEIYDALVLGMRDYIIKNGFQKAVVGLSGGIDSALTVAIAKDALGKDNVIGVSMPSRYSSSATQADAKSVAENLGIKFIEIAIDKIFDVYKIMLEKEFVGLDHDITEENLQARIRGNILMSFSNKFNWLVLTTGNKSEISVGYCTLYGDMAGGFAVIKDVPKMLVYQLARVINEKERKDLIPESIFTREPSAELKTGQMDRDKLPPYEVLDKILKYYVEEGMSVEKIIAKKFNPKTVKDVIQMVGKSEYKRRQAPLGVKITPMAFGKDRRWPITNKYRGFKK